MLQLYRCFGLPWAQEVAEVAAGCLPGYAPALIASQSSGIGVHSHFVRLWPILRPARLVCPSTLEGSAKAKRERKQSI